MRCTDVHVRTEGEEVIEFICTADRDGIAQMHVHEWQEYSRVPRCKREMNGYRCDLWGDHSEGCHSKDLMYALAGEEPPHAKK